MNKLTLKLIKQLPKVELHCHLDGSLRIDTIIDLAKKNNIGIMESSINTFFAFVLLCIVIYVVLNDNKCLWKYGSYWQNILKNY